MIECFEGYLDVATRNRSEAFGKTNETNHQLIGARRHLHLIRCTGAGPNQRMQ